MAVFPFPRCFTCALLLTFGVRAAPAAGPSAPVPAKWRPLAQVLARAVADGEIVGAQLAVGDRAGLTQLRTFGTIAPGTSTRVNGDTLFCIGSCSKPFAAACVLTLVDQQTITLDAPVGRWLPLFRRLQVVGGAAARRAPTVRELLAHRGGIYSQKEKLTPLQTRAIRDFSLTLAQSVDIIGKQKLLHQPGTHYDYSGAGYCVLGRAAEAAAGKPFDELLRPNLCRPLGLSRTTYFPDRGEKNIAVGGNRRGRRTGIDRHAPHLQGDPLRLPLIGGGLYSTSREMAAFARLVLNRGRVGRKQVLSPGMWREMTRRQYPEQDYGLGWGLTFHAGQSRAVSLGHVGALAGYRGQIQVDLASGHFLVACWTAADASDQKAAAAVSGQLLTAWRKAIHGSK
jgi:CubicO group peptidase (beta-lactamase class C family)